MLSRALHIQCGERTESAEVQDMASKLSVEGDLPQVTANIVPVNIQYSGYANTTTFFTNSKRTEKLGDAEAEVSYFRGLKLVGEKIDLNTKTGYLISKSELLVQGDAENGGEIRSVNQYSAVAKFDELILYGHDTPAPLNNQWKLMNEWDSIADVIHT